MHHQEKNKTSYAHNLKTNKKPNALPKGNLESMPRSSKKINVNQINKNSRPTTRSSSIYVKYPESAQPMMAPFFGVEYSSIAEQAQ